MLYNILAARSRYRDFTNYYKRFNYNDIYLNYLYRRYKALEYLFYYKKISL